MLKIRVFINQQDVKIIYLYFAKSESFLLISSCELRLEETNFKWMKMTWRLKGSSYFAYIIYTLHCYYALKVLYQ